MKDAKIFDGAAWQSLRGPAGPSTPSADAGNALTLGSDGLLYKTREVAFEYVPPELPSGAAAYSLLPLLWVNPDGGVVYVALPERPDLDPNGLGNPLEPKWQPINGPSQDAGNSITTGSDGLLLVEGETQFSGEWQPQFLGVGNDTSIDTTCAGYWVRGGQLVTLFIGVSDLEGTNVKGGSTLLGLPFSIKETMTNGQTTRNPYAGVVISSTGEIIGSLAYAATEDPVMVLEDVNSTQNGFSVSFTYLTDDPPLRGSI